jgi:hypothetical protein
MTIQASWRNHTPIVHLILFVARTQDPALRPRVPRHRQLEEQSVAPVKVGLAATAGPDDQIKALGLRSASVHAGLIVIIPPLLHSDIVAACARPQDIAAAVERAEDGLGGGRTRGARMSRSGKRLDDAAMTRRTIECTSSGRSGH